jgi:alpha-amylase/alpha-mannosidase (GH57 family)
MERYICIHGHFYQPPRENPWLEAIEVQDSAYPYHDWNERITAECYAPNATSRIMDGEGRIVRLVNNYSRISFNFGPTLMAWMEHHAPDVYAAIQQADLESRERYSGHGSALAQAYSHMILPLANTRDRQTQVIWGIRDFRKRFGRDPEGMWAPETAVDIESLDIMAEHGILFTILAPRQAKRVRQRGTSHWRDVSGGRIDPSTAYRLNLPSGRSISLFFYDGPISQGLAFEGLLSSGENYARRLEGAFSEGRSWPQIVHVATDGESYGHHHRSGDMALAYALHHIESDNKARLTNYGEYLANHPPVHEVEVFERSSWSCVHGVERWYRDCGCNSGGHPGWNQGWRGPLREALDWLRDTLEPAYEEMAVEYLKDPWEARNNYVDFLLDRSAENAARFLDRHALRPLDESERIKVFKLLELQRHTMLMYTSCGWFFDELSGIETVQVIQYAGRAVQLSRELFGYGVEPRFLQLLSRAKSNILEHGDGRRIYEKFVRPSMLDLTKVCAHYAVSSLFEDYGEQTYIGWYSVSTEDCRSHQAGRAKLQIGRAKFTSEITGESTNLCFGVLHLGDHNISCGVGPYENESSYLELWQEISDSFSRGEFLQIILSLDKYFGSSTYSLTSLFRDEQRKILDMIVQPTLQEAEHAYAQVYDNNVPLLRFLTDSETPVPRPLFAAAEFILNARLRNAFLEGTLEPQIVEPLLEETALAGVPLDTDTLEYALRKSIESLARQWQENPADVGLVRSLDAAATLVASLPFEVNPRETQNVCYKMIEEVYPDMLRKSEAGDGSAQEWIQEVAVLMQKLWIRMDPTDT